jgi:hypothetical protein
MDVFVITVITLIFGSVYYLVKAISLGRYEQGIALRFALFIICLIIVVVLNKIQRISLKPFFKKMLTILSIGIAVSALVVIILSSF